MLLSEMNLSSEKEEVRLDLLLGRLVYAVIGMKDRKETLDESAQKPVT